MKKLFQLLKTANLTPNGYYLMYCLTKNELIELPISHTTECQKLKILGYLDSSSNLTEKGKQVFDVIENYKSDKKVPPIKNIEEFKDNVSPIVGCRKMIHR